MRISSRRHHLCQQRNWRMLEEEEFHQFLEAVSFSFLTGHFYWSTEVSFSLFTSKYFTSYRHNCKQIIWLQLFICMRNVNKTCKAHAQLLDRPREDHSVNCDHPFTVGRYHDQVVFDSVSYASHLLLTAHIDRALSKVSSKNVI